MIIEKCDVCDEPLSDIEIKAKNADDADAWCCAECFYIEDEYSEHGKYHILLKFIKKLSKMSTPDCKECHCIVCQAKQTLEKVGGNEMD